MLRIPHVLLGVFLLAGCKETRENAGDPSGSSPVPTPDSLAAPPPDDSLPSNPSTTSSKDSISEDSTELPPPEPETFQRIPIERIDSALQTYDGGDTLSIDSVGNNECIGIPLNIYRLRHGLTLEGNSYHPYALVWTFEGKFGEVLGLKPGMALDSVRARLPAPAQASDDTLVYLSEKPDGYEHEYFDARWTITTVFKQGILTKVVFTPAFDDC
ncbi:MAG: hypothetical protein H6686_09695 [Fibrobacteria bacterium]|nr:hypothetical protein [Fibrobacteria bacterium]